MKRVFVMNLPCSNLTVRAESLADREHRAARSRRRAAVGDAHPINQRASFTFGLVEGQVKRTLAHGNLLPRIRDLYRHEQIEAVAVRHLARKAQQRDWLALGDDPEHRARVAQQLES